MKNLSKILFIAALAASFSVTGRATADDNIIASPKGREMINVRSGGRNASLTPAVAVTREGQSKVIASPKGLEMLAVRSGGRSAPSTVATSVGYTATGADGITASPKGRQQLDENHQHFMVAPIK